MNPKLFFVRMDTPFGQTIAGCHLLGLNAADAKRRGEEKFKQRLTEEDIASAPEEMRERIRVLEAGKVALLANGYRMHARPSKSNPLRQASNLHEFPNFLAEG